jgi:tellurite resistance protein TehA-like permease
MLRDHPEFMMNFPLLIFDFCILGLLVIPAYLTTLFYLFIRRYHQPLKIRGSTLIILSTLGNMMFSVTLMVNKIIANAYDVGSFFDD